MQADLVREGNIQALDFKDITHEFTEFVGVLLDSGIARVIANEIEARTEIETRTTVLGHVQRGGTPVPEDRVLATKFGHSAIQAVMAGSAVVLVTLLFLPDAADEVACCIGQGEHWRKTHIDAARFAAIEGSDIYQSFADGTFVYERYVLQKPT